MRRALALLAPSLTRRAAAPHAAPLLRQPFGGCAGFSADAAPSSEPTPRAAALWYADRALSVQELADEMFRRWEKSPTPGKGALDALLERVSTPAEAKVAASAVERFHKQRCAAGWLTGLGAKSSQLFATACRRAGAADTVVAAFSRAPALGLSITPDTARRILAAAAQQGADATLEAYRALRRGGLRVSPDVARMVMRGVQGPGRGGSPRRALDAGKQFLADGVAPGRRAWNALMCAAAAAPDVAALADVFEAFKAAGETANTITHLALAHGALVSGDTAAATEQLKTALALAPSLMGTPPPANADIPGTMARIVAAWVAGLPAGAAVPGGTAGLAARTREALAAAGGGIPLDVDAAFAKTELVDGPLAA